MKIEDPAQVKRIFEAALMAAEKPLMRRELVALFEDRERPSDELIDGAIKELGEDCAERGYELKRVASGYRYQVRQELSQWVSKLWSERAPRYSRALLETLALVAYRQPITRGEIEDIRGVAVSSNIIKTLLEREWIKVVGHRDVPGRPAIYATTKLFLDYFNLKSLDQLPPLSEVRDLSTIGKELDIELPEEILASANDEASEGQEVDAEDTGAAVAEDQAVEQEAKQEVEEGLAVFEAWEEANAKAGEEIEVEATEPEAPATETDPVADELMGEEVDVSAEDGLDREIGMHAAPSDKPGSLEC